MPKVPEELCAPQDEEYEQHDGNDEAVNRYRCQKVEPSHRHLARDSSNRSEQTAQTAPTAQVLSRRHGADSSNGDTEQGVRISDRTLMSSRQISDQHKWLHASFPISNSAQSRVLRTHLQRGGSKGPTQAMHAVHVRRTRLASRVLRVVEHSPFSPSKQT